MSDNTRLVFKLMIESKIALLILIYIYINMLLSIYFSACTHTSTQTHILYSRSGWIVYVIDSKAKLFLLKIKVKWMCVFYGFEEKEKINFYCNHRKHFILYFRSISTVYDRWKSFDKKISPILFRYKSQSWKKLVLPFRSSSLNKTFPIECD